MSTRQPHRRIPSGLFLTLVILSGTWDGFAQQPPQPSPPASKPDEAVALTPFEVRTDKDEGYVAQNTALGSRLNTNLKDTPAPISVFTQVFLEDIAATNLTDVSAYAVNAMTIPGFQAGAAQGDNVAEFDTQFRFRGLAAAGNTGRSVDFFPFPVEVDTFNTTRVEYGRGPNSILFGIGAAAGNFNVSSKKAELQKPFYEVSARGDSDDGLRYTLDLNQPVVEGKVGLRLNMMKQELNSFRPFEHNDALKMALAGKYQITKKTTLDVTGERGHDDKANDRPWVGSDYISDWINDGRQLIAAPNGAIPANSAITRLSGVNNVFNTTTDTVTNWQNQTISGPTSHFGTATVPGNQILLLQNFALVPKNAVIAGPGYGQTEDYHTMSVFLQQELVKGGFIELAFNKQHLNYLDHDVGAANIRVLYDTNAELPSGAPNPYAGKPFVQGQQSLLSRIEDSYDYRATGSYELDLGHIFGIHQFSVLGEYRDQTIVRDNKAERIANTPPVPGTPESPNNALLRQTYVDLSGGADAVAMANFRLQPLNGSPITTLFSSNGAQAAYNYLFGFTSLMAATHSSFWNDHIVATLGYRRDDSRSYYSTVARGVPQSGYTLGFFQAVRSIYPTKLDGDTRSAGVVVNVTKNFSAFYNTSSNFALPNPQIVIFPNTPARPTHGKSQDYGVKVSLIEGKLYATLTRYVTSAKDDADFTNQGPASNLTSIWNTLNNAGVLAAGGYNVTTQTANLAAGGNNFDSNSNGYEFELVASPTRNWRLFLNAAQNKTEQSNIDSTYIKYLDQYQAFFLQGTNGRLVLNGTAGQLAPLTTGNPGITTIADEVAASYTAAYAAITQPDGLSRLAVPKYSGNLRTNYTFSDGSLNGVSLGAGVRYQGPAVIGYTGTTPAANIWGNSNTLVDANVGYRRKLHLFDKYLDWSVQLNVKNVLDRTNIIITGAFTDGAPRQYILQPPAQYILSSTIRY